MLAEVERRHPGNADLFVSLNAPFRDSSRIIARRSLTLKRDQEPFSSRFVLWYVSSLVRGGQNSREPFGHEDAQAPGSVPRCATGAGRAARPPHTCPVLCAGPPIR